MTKIEKEVIKWWKQFRPVGWTELAHIENATVNASNTKQNSNLAKLAAQVALKRYNRDGTKK